VHRPDWGAKCGRDGLLSRPAEGRARSKAEARAPRPYQALPDAWGFVAADALEFRLIPCHSFLTSFSELTRTYCFHTLLLAVRHNRHEMKFHMSLRIH